MKSWCTRKVSLALVFSCGDQHSDVMLKNNIIVLVTYVYFPLKP